MAFNLTRLLRNIFRRKELGKASDIEPVVAGISGARILTEFQGGSVGTRSLGEMTASVLWPCWKSENSHHSGGIETVGISHISGL